MSDESEFNRYSLMYQALKERVARLGQHSRLVEQLDAELEALAQRMKELAPDEPAAGETEIGWQTCVCARCGVAYECHLDETLCPACREEPDAP